MDLINPNANMGLLQTQNQVGGNAANLGLGYGANLLAAKQGQKSALQKLAMARINQRGLENKEGGDLQSLLNQMQLDQQQASPFDFLGAGIGALGAISGIKRRDAMGQTLGMPHKNAFQEIFG